MAPIRTGMGDVEPGPGLDRSLTATVNDAAARTGVTVAASLAAAARELTAVGR